MGVQHLSNEKFIKFTDSPSKNIKEINLNEKIGFDSYKQRIQILENENQRLMSNQGKIINESNRRMEVSNLNRIYYKLNEYSII